MTTFQGTGFLLDLPEDTIDASTYFFVRNDGSSNPPTLRVTAQAIIEIPPDIDAHITMVLKEELAVAPDLILIDKTVNQRNDWIYCVVTLAWGTDLTSPRQRRIYLYVDGQPTRLFTLVLTSTNEDFGDATAYFADTIRSFNPNDIQNVLPEVG